MLRLKLWSMGLVVCAVFVLSSTASANCPNKTVKGKYGQHGHQGTCWKMDKLACKPCGKKHFPGGGKLHGWKTMPHLVRNKCMAKTLKKRVDGCSTKDYLKDPTSKDFNHVLKGACDAHDICYHSDATKASCDVKFLANMGHECKRYYHGHRNLGMRATCLAAAPVWAGAVAVRDTKLAKLIMGSEGAYKSDQKWAEDNGCK